MVSAQHYRRAPSRSWPQRLFIASGIVVTMCCVLAATAVGYVFWKTGRFQRADVKLDPVAGGMAPRNYLVIGSDSRANIDPSDPDASAFIGGGDAPTGQRSDTILLVRVDPVAADAKILSFPRDLWVPIAGTNHSAKINSAYGQGRQALIDTIRQDFDVEVNNYIEVDFSGFKGLVDAVGGVPLWFDTAMRDDNTGLDVENPGCIKLDGEQALAFARSRHLEYKDARGNWQEDPTADLGRITRQQIFVRKAMSQALSLGIATNPVSFYKLLDTATNSVTIDKSIDRGDMYTLMQQFRDYKPEDMKTYSLPVTNGASSDGQSILNLKTNEAQPLLNIFRGADPGPVLESDVTVDVDTARTGTLHAKDVQSALDAVGFVGGKLANAPEPLPAQTTILYAPGSELAADLVSRHLTTQGALLQADDSLAPNRVVLIAGQDFTTVQQLPRAATTINTTTTVPASGASATTSPPPTSPSTTTTVIGVTPGTPPDGVSC